MNQATTSLDVRRIVALVLGRWKTVAFVTIVVMAAAFAYTKVAKPVYQATAQVTYQAPGRDNNPTGGALPNSSVTRENIATLIANAANGDIIDTAARQAGVSEGTLRGSTSVLTDGDASVINFSAKSGNAAQAAKVATSYAQAFVKDRTTRALTPIKRSLAQTNAQLKSTPRPKADGTDPYAVQRATLQQKALDGQDDLDQWGSAIQVSNTARTPDAAVWPRPALTLFAALIAGFGLGIGIALLTASVDRKLRGDVDDELPTAPLVRVPLASSAPRSAPLAPSAAEPLVADAFAALGARVLLDRRGEDAHVVLVTSARSGEGKSTVAANLASALAQGGRRVILIDADMRRPTQDQIFPALHGRTGLSQVLLGATDVEAALTLVAPNLAAVASGPRQSNASVLLASVAFRNLVERLSHISDAVVIDAPPVLAVNDALAIAPAASQVLLVARVGISNLQEVGDAYAKIASASTTPQATVLVGTERPTGYGYDQDAKGAVARGNVAAMPARMSMPANAAAGAGTSAHAVLPLHPAIAAGTAPAPLQVTTADDPAPTPAQPNPHGVPGMPGHDATGAA